MAITHRHWTAKRYQQPPLLEVKGRLTSPDMAVSSGYAVTTGTKLAPLPSLDPTILRLGLVVYRAPSPTYDPHHEQSESEPRYTEQPIHAASRAYERVHIVHEGRVIAEITVGDLPKKARGL